MDKRVAQFLKQLGLERYASKFADEEIDFEALRLLHDSDFAKLRVPDAARRRIADALTAVPLLAQIQRAPQLHQQPEPQPIEQDDILPTQQFGTSRLATRMKRNAPLLSQDDSDGEYQPTQQNLQTGNETDLRGDEIMVGGDSDDKFQAAKGSDSALRPTSDTKAASQESNESSIDAKLADFIPKLKGMSQISVETKLKKWLDARLERENKRHKQRLERIHAAYSSLMEQRNPPANRIDSESSKKNDNLQPQSDQCDTVDLTDTPSDEEKPVSFLDLQMSRSYAGESIVISSNEDDIRATTVPRPSVAEQENEDNGLDDMADLDFPPLRPTNWKPSLFSKHKQRDAEVEKGTANDNSQSEVMDLVTPDEKQKRPQQRPIESDSDFDGPLLDLVDSTRNEETANRELKIAEKEDEEFFLDLVESDQENGFVFTQSNNRAHDASTQSRPTNGLQDGSKKASTDGDSSVDSITARLGRLRKKSKKTSEKLTQADVVRLIRSDEELYEEIIAMEAVPFGKIMERVRRCGQDFSRKLVCQTLRAEGVRVKWEHVVETGSKRATYMKFLNSDACTD